ncbi:hypothetical protein CEUSTIGMA_g5138.t1 [Chlamydomonas eustigma]|uniref:Uncharacterized protein n=1 Tax=Chlamydomonas eustigma TaxID=1157962 RepID=A0A250X3P4_9CHLO|nr:hypothetical protein CEUSTIGMA_g5138.t1 [Chlamydomonas eustigma]|eukprot:GAX77695.1 hypothetical protein CEUSTIGMA_g5138.t1 [Chlamydomonas eustigma]
MSPISLTHEVGPSARGKLRRGRPRRPRLIRLLQSEIVPDQTAACNSTSLLRLSPYQRLTVHSASILEVPSRTTASTVIGKPENNVSLTPCPVVWICIRQERSEASSPAQAYVLTSTSFDALLSAPVTPDVLHDFNVGLEPLLDSLTSLMTPTVVVEGHTFLQCKLRVGNWACFKLHVREGCFGPDPNDVMLPNILQLEECSPEEGPSDDPLSRTHSEHDHDLSLRSLYNVGNPLLVCEWLADPTEQKLLSHLSNLATLRLRKKAFSESAQGSFIPEDVQLSFVQSLTLEELVAEESSQAKTSIGVERVMKGQKGCDPRSLRAQVRGHEESVDDLETSPRRECESVIEINDYSEWCAASSQPSDGVGSKVVWDSSSAGVGPRHVAGRQVQRRKLASSSMIGSSSQSLWSSGSWCHARLKQTWGPKTLDELGFDERTVVQKIVEIQDVWMRCEDSPGGPRSIMAHDYARLLPSLPKWKDSM